MRYVLCLVLLLLLASPCFASSEAVHVLVAEAAVMQVESPAAAFLIGLGLHYAVDAMDISWLPRYHSWPDDVIVLDLIAIGAVFAAAMREDEDRRRVMLWGLIGALLPDVLKIAGIMSH